MGFVTYTFAIFPRVAGPEGPERRYSYDKVIVETKKQEHLEVSSRAPLKIVKSRVILCTFPISNLNGFLYVYDILVKGVYVSPGGPCSPTPMAKDIFHA